VRGEAGRFSTLTKLPKDCRNSTEEPDRKGFNYRSYESEEGNVASRNVSVLTNENEKQSKKGLKKYDITTLQDFDVIHRFLCYRSSCICDAN
jgi:hypothetical protein